MIHGSIQHRGKGHRWVTAAFLGTPESRWKVGVQEGRAHLEAREEALYRVFLLVLVGCLARARTGSVCVETGVL